MPKLLRPFRPLSESGFSALLPLDATGRYFHLHEGTGDFAFALAGERPGQRGSAGNVADLEAWFPLLPDPVREAFARWRDGFARRQPTVFNRLINAPLTQPAPSARRRDQAARALHA